MGTQSQVIPDRQSLNDIETSLKEKYKEGEVPKPDNWGGYRIVPHSFEFWQGQSTRIHDRYSIRQHRKFVLNSQKLTFPISG